MEAIERYLNHEMGDEERADFERRLANDPELAAAVALQSRIRAALRDREARAFRERLNKVRAERETQTPQTAAPGRWRRWLSLVLLAALALSVYQLYLVWHRHAPAAPPVETPAPPVAQAPVREPAPASEKQETPSRPTPQYAALARQYYRSPADLSSSGTRSNNEDSRLNLMQYASKQYAAACRLQQQRPALAIPLFKAVADTLAHPPEEIKIMAAYLRGHALFNAKNYRQAAEAFGFSARYEHKDAQAARWFQALALLALEAPAQQVLPILTQISKESGPHQQPARALLLKIQSR